MILVYIEQLHLIIKFIRLFSKRQLFFKEYLYNLIITTVTSYLIYKIEIYAYVSIYLLLTKVSEIASKITNKK